MKPTELEKMMSKYNLEFNKVTYLDNHREYRIAFNKLYYDIDAWTLSHLMKDLIEKDYELSITTEEEDVGLIFYITKRTDIEGGEIK